MCCKKNWNIFRRLKTNRNNVVSFVFCFLLSTFCISIFVSCDKEEKLYGSWLLQTTLLNGEPLNDSLQFNVSKYTYYTFFYQNSLTVTTSISGFKVDSPDGYYYFKNNSTIQMKYTLLYNRYDITAKIKKLTNRELNLEYEDNGNTYFLKLYSNK